MQTIRKTVHTASRYIDFLAGLILFGVAGLVAANILMRTLFNRPIVGTYELVGYLTAAAIGLALAHCAVQNSHIAVGFLADRLPERIQRLIGFFIDLPSTVFLSLAAWHLSRYAAVIAASGRVSPTIQIPFYPFIYLVALGFAVLAIVTALKAIDAFLREGEAS